MPEATNEPTTPTPCSPPPASAATRRSLFGTIGAALLLTAGEAGPTIPAESDAELIAVARQVEDGERRLYESDRFINFIVSEDEVEGLILSTGELGERLMAMRPTTPAGFLAKARAIREVMQNAIAIKMPSTVEELGDHHDLLAWSLVNDMIAAGSAAA